MDETGGKKMNFFLNLGLIGFLVSIILAGIFVFSHKERKFLAVLASILCACSVMCAIIGFSFEVI
jgi:biotin transporter BioY